MVFVLFVCLNKLSGNFSLEVCSILVHLLKRNKLGLFSYTISEIKFCVLICFHTSWEVFSSFKCGQ